MNLENLKEELIGFEGNVWDLDNKMIGLGFYSEADTEWNELLESECVNYVLNTGESVESTNLLIDFIITIKNGNDECIEATYIKITNVSKN